MLKDEKNEILMIEDINLLFFNHLKSDYNTITINLKHVSIDKLIKQVWNCTSKLISSKDVAETFKSEYISCLSELNKYSRKSFTLKNAFEKSLEMLLAEKKNYLNNSKIENFLMPSDNINNMFSSSKNVNLNLELNLNEYLTVLSLEHRFVYGASTAYDFLYEEQIHLLQKRFNFCHLSMPSELDNTNKINPQIIVSENNKEFISNIVNSIAEFIKKGISVSVFFSNKQLDLLKAIEEELILKSIMSKDKELLIRLVLWPLENDEEKTEINRFTTTETLCIQTFISENPSETFKIKRKANCNNKEMTFMQILHINYLTDIGLEKEIVLKLKYTPLKLNNVINEITRGITLKKLGILA